MHLFFDSITNSITLGGKTIEVTDLDTLPSKLSNIKQVYWYDTYGEIVYDDGSVEIVKELEICDDLVSIHLKEKTKLEEKEELEQLQRDEEFQSQLKKQQEEIKKQQEETKKIEEEEKQKLQEKIKELEEEYERNRDYWQDLRLIRNSKLLTSDWTQIPDAPLTEEQKLAWKNYRQALRDLPENITDPKLLVLDKNHSSWPAKP